MSYKWIHATCSFGDLASFTEQNTFILLYRSQSTYYYLFCCSNSPVLAVESSFKLAPVIFGRVPIILSTSFLSGTISWSWLILYFPFLSPAIPAQFSKEPCVPEGSTPVGQAAGSWRRGLGENLPHSLYCPTKREKGGLFSAESTEVAGRRG